MFHDEVEIEDFEYDEDSDTYYYPCPCGDQFQITRVSSLFFVCIREQSKQNCGILLLLGRSREWRRCGRVPQLLFDSESYL